MKKKVILGILIGGAILILVCVFANVYTCFTDTYDYERFKNPRGFSSYGGRIGYFKINPETILSDLEQGKTDVFTPITEDPFTGVDFEVADIEISWTQADFLKIASAVGQLAWDDPMDLNNWHIYSILFQGSCRDSPTGFRSANITYFRMINRNGEEFYETRIIEMAPRFSGIRWGGGATYPHYVGNWKGVDLAGDKITADDALRIADENGGKYVRLQDGHCVIMVDSSVDINNRWLASFIGTPSLNMYVDMETGMFEIIENNQPSFPTLVVPDTSDKE